MSLGSRGQRQTEITGSPSADESLESQNCPPDVYHGATDQHPAILSQEIDG